MRCCEAINPSAPRSPTTLRIFSAKTGVYSIQWPSPSMTGCFKFLRMSAGAWCELIKYSPEVGGGGKRHVALRKSVCLADAQVKPPHPLLVHNQAAKRHPKR